MNTLALRELIQHALAHEARTGHLAHLLEGQLARLHPSIQLPADDAQGVLERFVAAYVEQVPDVLDAAHAVAQEAGIEGQVKPVLQLAEQFFLSPPGLLEGHQGLDALLDESYLAHRLVEEVNDRYIAHFGQPLIPLDTTVANLIAHQLIGEPFANQLDEAVHHAVDEMLDPAVFQQASAQEYRVRLSNPQTLAAWQNWPCLSRQLGVELGLPA
ncbi:hypothetical protein A9179_21970 [Pseudomonas alcaligenes]|uniref:Uncharacterized protein n=1 Tax=Aquipseudomonas alcaligenes TaxID=43263 RepID=A0ABR7S7C7_AQUAC|nr:hypothetical protein [Pseudomonas alcaligenes]MBC9252937.1 hypothetical protein [Pseudomonas alcaligenes]